MKRKNQHGVAITEAAAALTILLPLIFVIIFAALEAGYAYTLKSSLSEAARQAARDLAIAYGQNPTIAGDRTQENSLVFDSIRIRNVLNDSSQFDDPVWNTSGDPTTVQVTVRYLGGQFGLPTFPNPDPLHLGSHFQVTATSTYRLE